MDHCFYKKGKSRHANNNLVPIQQVHRRINHCLTSNDTENCISNHHPTNILSRSNATPLGIRKSPLVNGDDQNYLSNEVRTQPIPMHNGSTVSGPMNVSNDAPPPVAGPMTSTGPVLEQPNNQEAEASSQHPAREINFNLFCSRCLGYGHLVNNCFKKIRCIYCYGYNHIARSCFNRRNKKIDLSGQTEPLLFARYMLCSPLDCSVFHFTCSALKP